MSDADKGPGAMTKIVGGIAVFIVCWMVQAGLGDSSMFSMSYVNQGFVPGLLVTVTFWPGWIVTVGLIGSGIGELLEDDDADSASWETE
jgi:hypothetical protein